jgi:sterol desaturase/sphingolipid hydroxylase (fatty acid hydroxylase superfamily)
MARRYVSNKNETVRMFESDFMEFFSHVHPTTPLIVFVPVIGYMLYLSVFDRGLDFPTIAGMFVVGVLTWTFLEYVLHRFVFHYLPKSSWGKRLHFILHGVHHDYPNDATRLVMPPGISIPLAVIFYVLFMVVFGPRLTPPTFAGMVFGYLCYDMLHYATHHFSMKKGVWLWLKQHHMRHHYGDDHTGYGVSSPLWDVVFGTFRKKPEKKG